MLRSGVPRGSRPGQPVNQALRFQFPMLIAPSPKCAGHVATLLAFLWRLDPREPLLYTDNVHKLHTALHPRVLRTVCLIKVLAVAIRVPTEEGCNSLVR